ncbi:helix-turn-helix domain-containing protein [Niabella sp. 22666]|uniref:helix-turn-helix domain-containing protein n=1 Tax=Niabella sp. 22666 TaxID=3453954 RepID=UPI003F83BBF1
MEKPFSLPEAADYLGVANITMYKNAKEGIVPGYKKGGKWFFFPSELLAWIKSGKAKSRHEIDTAVDAAITSHQ